MRKSYCLIAQGMSWNAFYRHPLPTSPTTTLSCKVWRLGLYSPQGIGLKGPIWLRACQPDRYIDALVVLVETPKFNCYWHVSFGSTKRRDDSVISTSFVLPYLDILHLEFYIDHSCIVREEHFLFVFVFVFFDNIKRSLGHVFLKNDACWVILYQLIVFSTTFSFFLIWSFYWVLLRIS